MSWLKINKSTRNIPVYSNIIDKNTYLGYIARNEIYAVTTNSTNISYVGFYTGGKFVRGQIHEYDARDGGLTSAFDPRFAYGSGTYIEYGGQESVRGYRFNVKHKCRIFSGTSEVQNLYAGDFVIVDGDSISGSKYPYRLNIVGYSKDGRITIDKTDMWCDTDIEIGWNQPYNTAVVGKW